MLSEILNLISDSIKPLSLGLFMPSLLTGAAFGRLIGVVLHHMFPGDVSINLQYTTFTFMRKPHHGSQLTNSHFISRSTPIYPTLTFSSPTLESTLLLEQLHSLVV